MWKAVGEKVCLAAARSGTSACGQAKSGVVAATQNLGARIGGHVEVAGLHTTMPAWGNGAASKFKGSQSFGKGARSFSESLAEQSSDSTQDKDKDTPYGGFRPVPNAKVLELADEIVSLSLIEVAELTKILKERLGIDDSILAGAAPVAAAPAADAGAGNATEKEEKTSFDVKLEAFDATTKLKIIKEVRAITGLGLKEAKELVEKAPSEIKSGVTKEEAETLKTKLSEVGATIKIE